MFGFFHRLMGKHNSVWSIPRPEWQDILRKFGYPEEDVNSVPLY